MPSSALLGVDVGTSSVKVVGFDTSGHLVAQRRGATPTERLSGGLAEHDVDALRVLVVRLIGEVVSALDGSRVEAVAAASVGEAIALLDEAGEAVRPAIAWYDPRGVAEAEWWAREIGRDVVYRTGGQVLDAHYGVNKVMWVRRNEPGAFARARYWLSMGDLVTYWLCGVFGTDFSLASRTMCFDQRRLDWSDELLGVAGLNRSRFPPAYPSGSWIGAVTPEAAAATGLLAGTPVVVGGHDRLCAAFAARGNRRLPVDSTGSAEALVVPVEEYVERTTAEAGSIACYADVVPRQYVFSARVGYAGALVDWYRRDVLGEDASVGHLAVEAEIEWPLSFSGLLCYPSFGRVLAPVWDEAAATGAVFGLTLGHRPSHVLQALIEGVCYSLRANLDWLERLTNQPVPVLRAEGKVTLRRVWAQLKAEVTGRRIETVRLEEATALGAALLAGTGCGIYRDHAAAGAAVEQELEARSPTPVLAATYTDVFEHGFCRLPALVGEVATVLSRAKV